MTKKYLMAMTEKWRGCADESQIAGAILLIYFISSFVLAISQ